MTTRPRTPARVGVAAQIKAAVRLIGDDQLSPETLMDWAHGLNLPGLAQPVVLPRLPAGDSDRVAVLPAPKIALPQVSEDGFRIQPLAPPLVAGEIDTPSPLRVSKTDISGKS